MAHAEVRLLNIEPGRLRKLSLILVSENKDVLVLNPEQDVMVKVRKQILLNFDSKQKSIFFFTPNYKFLLSSLAEL